MTPRYPQWPPRSIQPRFWPQIWCFSIYLRGLGVILCVFLKNLIFLHCEIFFIIQKLVFSNKNMWIMVLLIKLTDFWFSICIACCFDNFILFIYFFYFFIFLFFYLYMIVKSQYFIVYISALEISSIHRQLSIQWYFIFIILKL